MSEHSLKNIPKTEREARCQKGPVPLMAVFLVIALFTVLVLFWGLPLFDSLTGPQP